MKETIKIAFADFWPEFNEEDIFTPILEKYYNVVVDQNNPDVLFHSMFGGAEEARKYTCKKILFLGENYRPNKFDTDFSISFDQKNKTNFRLPLWQYFILLRPEYLERLTNRVKLDNFDNFCSFTVSNPNNFVRNATYQQLLQYKPIQSYGRYMTNNFGLINYSNNKYWRDAKDEFFTKHTHKFSIAYENNSYPFYTTEKLMDSFLVGAMPIYWGDSRITDDFNELAFVNGVRLGSRTIDVVKEMDNDSSLFDSLYSQPVFTISQKNKLIDNLGEFETWLINIIK